MQEKCYYADGCKVAQFSEAEQRVAWTAIELLDSSLYRSVAEWEQSTQTFLSVAVKKAIDICRSKRCIGDCVSQRPAELRNSNATEMYIG